MKLKNSTSLSEPFLRKMVAFCRAELGLRRENLKLAVFRRSRSCWGGAARYWKGQITVCIGRKSWFPIKSYLHRGGIQFDIADQMEALVMVTAHELAHLYQYQERARTRGVGSWGGSELSTDWHTKPILEKFRQQRAELLADWNQAPPAVEKPSPVLKRAEATAAALARWQKKLALAKTKVRLYTRRAQYYAKAVNGLKPRILHTTPAETFETQPVQQQTPIESHA